MILNDEYSYFKADALKYKTKPFTMHNKPLAADFYSRLKAEYPAARIYYSSTGQYICVDDRQRKGLIKLLKKQQEAQESALQETLSLIAEVKEGGL